MGMSERAEKASTGLAGQAAIERQKRLVAQHDQIIQQNDRIITLLDYLCAVANRWERERSGSHA
jgi:hypothetical protein